MNAKIITLSLVAVATASTAALATERYERGRRSIPSVVVEVENLAPERGTFMTPVLDGHSQRYLRYLRSKRGR